MTVNIKKLLATNAARDCEALQTATIRINTYAHSEDHDWKVFQRRWSGGDAFAEASFDVSPESREDSRHGIAKL